MSRGLAYSVHFGLGAIWLLILIGGAWGVAGSTVAGLWGLCALGLWIADAARMGGEDAAGVWRVTFLWWLGSFVSPAVAAVRGYRAFTEPAGLPISSANDQAEAPMNDDELTSRLNAAEQAVAALQRELAELRALAARPAAAAPTPAPAVRVTPPPPSVASPKPPDTDVPWWERKEPVWAEPEAEAAPPAPLRAAEPAVVAPPPQRPEPPRQPEPPRPPEPPREPPFWDRDVSFSDLVGPKAFAIAGGVVTLLGVVFFFVLAANRGWIGPELRVLLGAAASGLVFAGGFWLRRREPDSYSSLAAVGAGVAGGYVTLAAATVLYGLLPAALALPIAASIAAAGVAVALRWSSQLVAALGLLGAIAAPALLALDEGISVAGAAFVAIVLAAAAVVALRERWPELLVAAAASGIAQAVWLVFAADGSDWGAVSVAAAFAAILVATGIASEVTRRFSFSASLVLAGAGFAGFAARMLFDGDDLGVSLLVVGLVFAAVAAGLFVRGGLVDLSSLAGAIAMSFGAVAAAQLLSGQSLAIAWAAQAAVLAWLARAIDEPRYQLGALAYVGLSLGHTLAFDAPVTDLFTPEQHPAAGAPTVLALVLAQVAVAWFAVWEGARGARRLAELDEAVHAAQDSVRLAAGFAAPLLAVYALSLGILELAQLAASDRAAEVDAAFEWGHVAVTTTAALAALIAFLVSGRFGGAVVRSAVAVALAVVLVKTTLFDLTVLEPERAGWSALALGSVLFLFAVLSHRLEPVVAELDVVSFAATLISAGLGAFAAVALLEATWGAVDLEGLGLLGLALPFALVGALELRRLRDYASLLLAIAFVAAGAASAFLLEEAWLVLAWSIVAAAAPALALVVREPRFLVPGYAYALIALSYTGTLDDEAGWAAVALGGGLFVAGVLGQHASPISRSLDPIAATAVALSACLGAYAAIELLDADVEGFGVLALAAPFALAGTVELNRRRDYASLHFALAVIAAGAASWLLFDGNWLVLAWAALAATLAGITVVSGESRFLIAAHVYAGLAVVYALGVDAPPADLFVAAKDPGSGVPAVVLASAAALVVALLSSREDRYQSSDERPLPVAMRSALPSISEASLWIAGALGVYALSLSLLQLVEWVSPAGIDTDFQRGHVAVSASWGIVGLALLYGGLRYGLTRLRVAGLVLFGISLAKLFLYDLTFLTSIARAFSFLAVGALLLLAGFFYQRLIRSGGSAPA